MTNWTSAKLLLSSFFREKNDVFKKVCFFRHKSIAPFVWKPAHLNFEVTALCDIKLKPRLSKVIHLSRDFWPF